VIYRENGQFKTTYAADQQIFTIGQDKVFVLSVIVFAFIGIPLLADEYMFRAILIPFLILSLAALGVNLLVGYCGQITLGAGAFMAIGAYAAYNFMIRIDGMPLIFGILLGGLATAGMGILSVTGPSCGWAGLPTIRHPARCLFPISVFLAGSLIRRWRNTCSACASSSPLLSSPRT
jgi:ABC-type branched-subunit amino acid transport system permease subunit